MTRTALAPLPDAAAPAIPILLLSGRIADLADFKAGEVDFAEMAAGLSKVIRWSGRHRSAGFSVAQHCVLGADAIYAETGDAVPAGYFLLHDGHEYLIGDQTRPAVAGISYHLQAYLREIGITGPSIGRAVELATHRLKESLDAAIHAAANRPPLSTMPAWRRIVEEMDERMCRIEAIALYGNRGELPLMRNDLPAPKLTSALLPWPAMKAELAFIERLDRYLGMVVRPV